MSKERILVVEAEPPQASRILSVLELAQHTASAVSNCAEAAEALLLQKFDAVLIGSGQVGTEVAELAGCIRTSGHSAPLLAYTGTPGVPVDGMLPMDFDALQFEAALRDATRLREDEQSPELLVFEPEKFAEQCADEVSLMVEIIDLFDGERDEQMAAMNDALAVGDFDRLGKLAHTLKGSVGALHAPAARQTCQAIELAAKDRDPELCEAHLRQLSQNLTDLAGPLSRFRQSCLEA